MLIDSGSGDSGVGGMIRSAMRDLVEAALKKGRGDVDSRRELRAAGQSLGNALAAHADPAVGPAPSRRMDPPTASTPAARPDDTAVRAHAFRIMAGVAA